jgi:nicotinate-nucleotide adenylyltransferase
VHTAHLIVAGEAADEFRLDQVLFIPAAHPPHKADILTPYEHRFRMVEIACAADKRFVPSRLEEGRGKSYSIHTIERVKAGLTEGDRLFFLIGADAFAEIESWFRADEVIRAVAFIVVTRPGHQYKTPPGAQVHRLETVALPISSSEVRQKLARGQWVKEMPESVAAYIREHGLYR